MKLIQVVQNKQWPKDHAAEENIDWQNYQHVGWYYLILNNYNSFRKASIRKTFFFNLFKGINLVLLSIFGHMVCLCVKGFPHPEANAVCSLLLSCCTCIHHIPLRKQNDPDESVSWGRSGHRSTYASLEPGEPESRLDDSSKQRVSWPAQRSQWNARSGLSRKSVENTLEGVVGPNRSGERGSSSPEVRWNQSIPSTPISLSEVPNGDGGGSRMPDVHRFWPCRSSIKVASSPSSEPRHSSSSEAFQRRRSSSAAPDPDWRSGCAEGALQWGGNIRRREGGGGNTAELKYWRYREGRGLKEAGFSTQREKKD